HRNLQLADLTINFNSVSWFSTENKSDTYMQMYERGLNADGELRMKDSAANCVGKRAAADDRVTIPQAWKNTPAVTRGLAPRQNEVRIRQQMEFGKAVEANKSRAPGVPREYTASNPHFNPKTKQVFAAVNYGRIRRGAATEYGYSFFVLDPGLK